MRRLPKTPEAREMIARRESYMFATRFGGRMNPRNRHNHGHKGQTDRPHVYCENVQDSERVPV